MENERGAQRQKSFAELKKKKYCVISPGYVYDYEIKTHLIQRV